jgi:hypothetical protein
VLRQVPAIEAKPDKRTAEHQAGMEQARTDLANRRPIPMPAALPAQPMRETEAVDRG